MKGTSQLRKWFVGVSATLLVFAGLPCMAAPLTSLTVNTLDDVVDDNYYELSLREALSLAFDGDTIDFDPTLLPGTIYLDPDLGTLAIEQSLTIAGPGPELLTIDGQCTTTNEYSVFMVGSPYMMTEVQISGLHITRGGSSAGGAVLNYAKLTMSDCIITGCQGIWGGGVTNVGEMEMNDCELFSCQALAIGGAVFNGGVMFMSGCELVDNYAVVGGAIANSSLSTQPATLTLEDCEVNDNAAMYFGGAVFNGYPFPSNEWGKSTASLTDCNLAWNIVYTRDPSSSFLTGSGGAICQFSWGSDASLSVDGCVLSNNAAALGGGIGIMAIFDDGDEYNPVGIAGDVDASIINSTLRDNLAWINPDTDPVPDNQMAGGALAIVSTAEYTDLDNTFVSVDQCTLNGNAVLGDWSYGGAIAYSGNSANTTLSITDSTVSNNSVEGVSGAFGGGILLIDVSDNNEAPCSLVTAITNSTISGNSVVLTGEAPGWFSAEGGGILNMGDLFIDNCTLADNVDYDDNPDVPPSSGIFTQRNPDAMYGGEVHIKNTVLANDPSGRNINSNQAEVTSYGYNISTDDSSLFLDEPTDMNSTDPRLGPLADNGGPTQTHLLMAGSPAINAASATDIAGNSVVLDQRGVVRPQGSANDIGAVEVEQVVPVSALEISEATVVRERRTTVVTILVSNVQSETAWDSMLTTATLGGIQCVERLPMRLGTIVSGNTKERQLTFKDVPLGEVTLVLEGTSSLGDFSSTQTLVLMP